MSKIYRKSIIILRFSAVVLMLSGCVKLLPDQGPRPRQITLDPTFVTLKSAHKSHHSIAITKPTAATMLESNRLVIHYEKDRLSLMDHIADVTYQETLPDLVQRHLKRAFIASQHFTAVGFATDTFHKTYIFESDIDQFAIQVQSNKRLAVVTISARLLDSKTRKTMWQQTFSHSVPISTHTISGFITALKTAYEHVLRQITQKVTS